MTEYSPIVKRLIEEAHEERVEKKAGRNRGLFSVGQRWQRRSMPGMIPGGTKAALGRARTERAGEYTAGLIGRTVTGGAVGGLLGGLLGNPGMGTGVGAGLAGGDSLRRINRLNRAAEYLNSRAKGERKTKAKWKIERTPGTTFARRGVYKAST